MYLELDLDNLNLTRSDQIKTHCSMHVSPFHYWSHLNWQMILNSNFQYFVKKNTTRSQKNQNLTVPISTRSQPKYVRIFLGLLFQARLPIPLLNPLFHALLSTSDPSTWEVSSTNTFNDISHLDLSSPGAQGSPHSSPVPLPQPRATPPEQRRGFSPHVAW